MSWNYRVFSTTVCGLPQNYIGEAYYDGDQVKGYTGAVGPLGETLEELQSDLQNMAGALDKPVIPLGPLDDEPADLEFKTGQRERIYGDQQLVDRQLILDAPAAFDRYLERMELDVITKAWKDGFSCGQPKWDMWVQPMIFGRGGTKEDWQPVVMVRMRAQSWA